MIKESKHKLSVESNEWIWMLIRLVTRVPNDSSFDHC